MVYHSFNKPECKHGIIISPLKCSQCIDEAREMEYISELAWGKFV